MCLGGKHSSPLVIMKLFILFLLVVAVATANLGNIIQLTDLIVDQNDSIIVVDQSGAGNSTTIQGAVDMIPNNNPSRIKIVINYGLYK